MSDLIVRKAAEKDVDSIARLEKLCFADPWSRESVYYDVAENRLAFYLVAEADGEIAGYAGIWSIAGEGHITNVAVAPRCRRRGIGDALMKAMIEVTEEKGISSHTLEVRKSNEAAIGLYKKHGFKVCGERKAYYQDNGEDALIMWREK